MSDADATTAGDTSAESRPADTAAESPAIVADEVLVAARALARAALIETTPEHTVGDDAGHIVEGEHVLSLRFESRLEGYVGWFWTVTIARVDDAEPTVLELSLLPGDGALVAPDWVPWSERLADYRASQEAAASEEPVDDDDDTDDDADELDESDLAADDDLDIDDAEIDDIAPDGDDDDDDDDSDDGEDSEDEDDSDDDDSDDDDTDDDDSDDDDDDDTDEYDGRRR